MTHCHHLRSRTDLYHEYGAVDSSETLIPIYKYIRCDITQHISVSNEPACLHNHEIRDYHFKMGTAGSSETLVSVYKYTRCDITQYSTNASKESAVTIFGPEKIYTMKIMEAGSSETSLFIYQTIRRNSPK
jgi:hypothetical protein